MDIGKELERITAEPLEDPVPSDTPSSPDHDNPKRELEKEPDLVPAR